MQSTRSRIEHDNRRRTWSGAFSAKALQGYEVRIQRYNQELIQQFDSFSGMCLTRTQSYDNDSHTLGQPIDMSEWFNRWSFDVMGDLAFGKSFSMVQSASTHWAIKLLNDSQDGAGLALPDWAARFMLTIPIIRRAQERFVVFCGSQIQERMALQGKQEQPDITHFLIEEFLKKDEVARSEDNV